MGHRESRAKQENGGPSYPGLSMLAVKSTDPHGSQSPQMFDGSSNLDHWSSSSTLSPASSRHCFAPSSQNISLPATVDGARELNRCRKARTDELLSRSIGVCSEHRRRLTNNAKTPSRVYSAPNLSS